MLRHALPVLAILLGLSISIDTDSLFPLLRGGETAADIVRRSQEYRRLVAANNALQSEVDYLRTRDGAKWAVFRSLGLVERGQQVGRLVEAPAPPAPVLSKQEQMRNWIVATEEYNAQLLRGAAQVLGCYAGIRPLDQVSENCNRAPAALSKKTVSGLKGKAQATASAGPAN